MAFHLSYMYKISCWKWHKYTNVHRVLAVTKIQWGMASWSGQFSRDVMKEDFLLSWQQKRATQETVTVGRKQEYCISYTRKFTPQNLDLEKPYMGWLVQSGAENTSYTKASWKCWGLFLFYFLNTMALFDVVLCILRYLKQPLLTF